MTAREYTADEIRQQFLDHIDHMIQYWARLPADPAHSIDEDRVWRLEGLTHSMLAALDGCSMALPAFIVAPMPHESDQAFYQGQDENWYPYNDPNSVRADIGGALRYWRSSRSKG